MRSETSSTDNPLLTAASLPPFSAIRPEHVGPAFDALLADYRAAIAAMTTPDAPRDFDTVMLGQERLEQQVARAWSPVGHLHSVADTPALREVYGPAEEKLTDHALELGQNRDLYAAVQALADAQMRFTCEREGAAGLDVLLNLAGEHNVRNALAAIAIAMELDCPDEAIQRALAKFAGVGRRFEKHGEWPAADGGRFVLIDDYGHHPVEMAAVLAAARGAYPGQRLVLAFQPHRYTRTRDCFADFVRVMQGADVVLLTEVYSAGESPIEGATGMALAKAVGTSNFVARVADMPAALAALTRDGDVVIGMGAGSMSGLPSLVAQHFSQGTSR